MYRIFFSLIEELLDVLILHWDRLMGTGSFRGSVGLMSVVVHIGAWENC